MEWVYGARKPWRYTLSSEADSSGQPGAAPLAGLVDYQPDAVVSKVLAKSAGGNVTLFAFAAGQELSEHTAPFEALIYVLDGAAEIGIAEERHQVGMGELIRLPATVPHWVKAIRSFKMMLIMLREPGAKTSA